MVGTAVYQVGWKASSHSKKRKALKSPGQAMAPPAERGASSPAMSPWIWKRGITSRQRSSEVRARDSAMLAAETERLACVRGHRLRARGGAGSLEDKGDVFGGGGRAGARGEGRPALG